MWSRFSGGMGRGRAENRETGGPAVAGGPAPPRTTGCHARCVAGTLEGRWSK